MQTLRSVVALSAWRRALQRESVTIGFVPTMGALHDGHRALIRTARLACDAVIVSIFVNPTQFGRGEDFARYPRPFRRDLAICRKEGIDVVFAPSRKELYRSDHRTLVIVAGLSRRWEGEERPGHFEGVATVVTKLLSLVQPDQAFFGQKDYQQSVVVRRMATDLNLPGRIVVCPTVREPDGLALSSRNAYLNAKQRKAAPILYRALQAGEAAIRGGMREAVRVRRLMHQTLRREPSVRLDYVAVCDPDSLEPVARVERTVVLLGAIRIGHIRLIDNILVACG